MKIKFKKFLDYLCNINYKQILYAKSECML